MLHSEIPAAVYLEEDRTMNQAALLQLLSGALLVLNASICS